MEAWKLGGLEALRLGGLEACWIGVLASCEHGFEHWLLRTVIQHARRSGEVGGFLMFANVRGFVSFCVNNCVIGSNDLRQAIIGFGNSCLIRIIGMFYHVLFEHMYQIGQMSSDLVQN